LNTTIWAHCNPLEIVQDTIALAKLAHTYEIPNLQMKVKNFLNPLMQAYPPLACSVFDLADPISTPDVYAAALVIIREQPYVALKTGRSSSEDTGKRYGPLGGIIILSPDKLEDVMSDNDVEADELFLFQQLVAWRDYNEPKYMHANSICKSMVRHLDLSSIDPNEIETTVMQSGFVTADMVVQALMAQAKSANKQGLAFASIRGPRGKKYAHILVQNAGIPDANGVYIHVNNINRPPGQNNPTQGRNLVYFIKKPAVPNNADPLDQITPKTYILVQDDTGIWRLCDSDKNILYDWHPDANPGMDFPHSGWSPVAGELPRPECSWLREPQHPNKSTSATDTTSATSTASPRSVTMQTSSLCPVSSNQDVTDPYMATGQLYGHRATNTATVTFNETVVSTSKSPSHVTSSGGELDKWKNNISGQTVVNSFGGDTVTEEKKEATEHDERTRKTLIDDASELTKKISNIKSKEKEGMGTIGNENSDHRTIVDDVNDLQKTISNVKGKHKEKRKLASRKSSLMDELEGGPSSIIPPDPIVGTTIGGGNVFSKQENKNDATHNVEPPQVTAFSKPKGVKHSGVTASMPPPKQRNQSSPTGCLLPATISDPVLVGCAAAMNPANR
jgi:hypothetical protein